MSNFGYATVQIIPSLKGMQSQIQGDLDKMLGQAGAKAGRKAGDGAGSSWGERFRSGASSALSSVASTMQSTLTTAAAVTGGLVATSLFSGFNRLQAIDDAEGKLRGLGHSAAEIETIMDSALASVKGTSFGLGDAATVAATAVAAGVEPGQELTRYLTLIGDAATIAGVPLSEMGSIINKNTTSGKVFTAELNQLADRGLPVFTWLQEAYGVSGEELRKMVADGKIESGRFLEVIEENIGGAALASGDTFRGGLANVKAAMGRAGATFLEPFFEGAKEAFPVLIEMIDGWGESLGEVMEGLGGSGLAQSFVDALKNLPDLLDRVSGALEPIKSLLGPLAGLFGAAGLGGLSSALGPLGGILPRVHPLLGLFAGLVATSKPLQDAFLGLAESVGPLLADLGARFVPIMERIQPIVEQVGVVLIGLVEDSLAYFLPVLNPILDALPGLLNALSPLIPVVGELAGAVVALIGPFVALVGDGLAVLLPYVVDLVAWISDLAAVLLGGLTDGIEAFTEFLAPLIEAISAGDWGAVWDALGDQLDTAKRVVGDWISGLIGAAKTELPKLAAAVGEWFVSEGPGILAKLGEWTATFGLWVLDLVVQIPGMLAGVAVAVGEWIVSAAPGILAQLATWAGAFVDWALDVWLSIPGWMAGILTAVGTWIVSVAPTVFTKLLEWGTAFRNWVIDTAQKMPGWLWDIATKIFAFITSLPGMITRLASGMFDGIKAAFRAAINWIIDRWNNLSFTVPGVSTPFGDFGGQTINTPNIPRLASGGVITEPTLAWVGETARARPEIVTPEYLMRDVVRDALAEQQPPYPPGDIVLQVDGRELARASAPWLRRDRRAAA